MLFWGHRPQPDGTLGPSCLSQWWPAPFVVDGRRYATAEHWMMWRKAVLFGDADAAAQVLASDSPAEAKAVGRGVRGFESRTWVRHRWEVVVAGSVAKFGSDPALRDYLLSTGDAVLVEASPDDLVWGTGLAAAHPDATVPARWPGLNLLGQALVEARSRLRDAVRG
ncbi:NADAR family protein [Nocardioides sp. AX2bis]|uniref:NADAR family protein n=1 Tax=Nocardioides sp. AX2bis TaxID=2653157 RepID=UPI0022A6C233|nr:NADAR family protein [Nocardioides sp. AX2bis]